jgi:hypothetical protein
MEDEIQLTPISFQDENENQHAINPNIPKANQNIVILENKLLPPADCVKITESVSWAKSQFTIFSETIDEKSVAALHHQKPIYHEEDCEQERIVIEDNKTSITNTGLF